MTDSSFAQQWRPGPKNLITDVPGVLVGNASDAAIKSGVTVLTASKPFVASVDVMGAAPGTRETDCLAPEKLVEHVDALVLSGGSAFGLDAASGVVNELRTQGRGFRVGPVQVPIVPAAIVFDLLNGGASDWSDNPYPVLGSQAFKSAGSCFELGSAGAGTGATTALLKGGLGSASIVMPNGVVVGALVVVNPHGSVVVPGHRQFWAAPFEMDEEFGGLGLPPGFDPYSLPRNEKIRAYEAMRKGGRQQAYRLDTEHRTDTAPPKEQATDAQGDVTSDSDESPQGMNTTIAVVASSAIMNKAQLKRMAEAAQDGMARAIVPAHTPLDGDLIFSVSMGESVLQDPVLDCMQLGHAAAVCLSRAIARGVYHAKSCEGDTLPAWHTIGDR